MSVENLKEYARRCATDPELRDMARSIGMTDVEEHMRHAESMGLSWTAADMVAFRKEVIDAAEDDLVDISEEELEQVAGGFATATAVAVVGVSVGVAAGAVAGGAAGAAVGGGASAAGDGSW